MQLSSAILFNELGKIKDDKIKFYLYKKYMNNYNAWILCCDIDSNKILDNTWEDIVDCVAIHLQANLELEIERSNIYIVFFLNDIISKKLKMEIEYDKYSSRKIVINEKCPQSGEEIEKKVDSFIFNIENKPDTLSMDSLKKWMLSNEKEMLNVYTEYEKGDAIEKVLHDYMKI